MSPPRICLPYSFEVRSGERLLVGWLSTPNTARRIARELVVFTSPCAGAAPRSPSRRRTRRVRAAKRCRFRLQPKHHRRLRPGGVAAIDGTQRSVIGRWAVKEIRPGGAAVWVTYD
ncbi:hypothetical protein GCM10009675_38000 [Prauserella alba]|uniref:Uncharacterized protein n=1 Tax=Prauserella alba TaxID=176898 RepID=A0ABN1VIH4_9PSEU